MPVDEMERDIEIRGTGQEGEAEVHVAKCEVARHIDPKLPADRRQREQQQPLCYARA